MSCPICEQQGTRGISVLSPERRPEALNSDEENPGQPHFQLHGCLDQSIGYTECSPSCPAS